MSNITNDADNWRQEFLKKPYSKIDLIGKLHIIHAFDNGQPKSDIARDYGVHPQTITYIYKQKEVLLKKYSQKYNLLNEVRCNNLNQTLLDWITSELKTGKTVNEGQLRHKAEEIFKNLSEEFNCIDDWLTDFCRRNNIMKFTSSIKCSQLAKNRWENFIHKLDVNNVYVGGIFGLYHSFDFDQYANQQNAHKYLSLMFIVSCSGIDKKELLVIGDEVLEQNNVRSIPLRYFLCHKNCIKLSMIQDYLIKWDNDLKEQNRTVSLILNIPENFLKYSFDNIKIKTFSDMEFVTQNITMIIKNFKFHYRRIQIIKKILSNKDSKLFSLLDYMNIMSAAWNSIAPEYIQRLFFPPDKDSLYLNKSKFNNSNNSLWQWCKLHNISGDYNIFSQLLESYIECEKNLQIIDTNVTDDVTLNVNETLLNNDSVVPSEVQAFQAIKRLINYLKSQNAEKSVIKCAKSLEDHLEFGALQEIQKIIADNNKYS
ncbi:tigger transposable element-derived protein 4-like [Battus philenor]|uniref:tigger transposable element-derived protein 4-like n=1 Tax=Battus philenor TaxID=42288 RepID=UPI0035D066DB